jgi:hypothetical protein
MRKGFLKYGEMHKYLVIYWEAISPPNFLIYEENFVFFFYQCGTVGVTVDKFLFLDKNRANFFYILKSKINPSLDSYQKRH